MAGGASLVAHGAMFAGLGFALAPEPVEQQPVPKSELTVSSYQVDQSDAAAQATQGEAAQERAPNAPRMGSGAIERTQAKAVDAKGAAVARAPASGDVLAPVAAETSLSKGVSAGGTALESAAALGEAVQSTQAVGQNLTAEAVASERPETAAPIVSAKLAAVAAQSPSVTALRAEAATLGSAALSAEISAAVEPAGMTLEDQSAGGPVLGSSAPVSDVLTVARAPQAAALEAVVETAALGAVQPRMALMQPAVADAARPEARDLPSVAATAAAPLGETLTLGVAEGAPAAQQDLPSEFATASLAWSGEDELVADPVSLAAIEAFMRPSDLDRAGASSDVRDGIEAILATVPCARLQTEFNPDTGSLLLRGHIPEDGLREPVLKALKAQVGDSIPIEDTLLILPRPQCGALSGIADVGLPQSTDHATNPRVVGPQGFARNYSYSNGQRLILELVAPDYPSVVYVDYFTADGMVLHLQPNDIVPLEAYPAKSGFSVGKERSDGPSLNLTVSPPFGQEIAVAFAASVPVYDGLRPISEPAEPYLAFLREQIALTRARDPQFKGEWAYFFISTTPE